MPQQPITIFYLCTHWWGSDARALGQALRAQGHTLIEGIYEDYFPQSWRSTPLRIARKLIRPWIEKEYNQSLLKILDSSNPDLVLVFKGMLLSPEVLIKARQRKIPVYCVYPDITFDSFGDNIVECLKLYDVLFTTKRFHLELPDQPKLKLPEKRILISHGYDPEVHRPLNLTDQQIKTYGCDAAYVGVWTPKKEATLSALTGLLPNLDLQIWGPGWERADSKIRAFWKNRGAYGDEATLIYQAAKINLCILTEGESIDAPGDTITVRTWQIPASGGFLLHEETDELKLHFTLREEVGTFSDIQDMAKCISYYLEHPEERERIRLAGHQRCLRDKQTYHAAAESIMAHFYDPDSPNSTPAS